MFYNPFKALLLQQMVLHQKSTMRILSYDSPLNSLDEYKKMAALRVSFTNAKLSGLKEKKSVLRQFIIPPPYQSIKDIFCLRIDRVVDNYRTVSINKLQLRFNNAPIREKVNLRIYPHSKSDLSKVRFWHKNKLLDIQQVKTELLLPVHF